MSDRLVAGSPPGVSRAPAGDVRAPAPGPVRWYAVVVLMMSTGAFFAASDEGQEGQSRSLVLLVWLVLYAIAALGLLDGALRERRTVPAPPALVAFLLLAMASVGWSVAPGVTVRRSLALLGTVLVALFLSQRLSASEVFDALRRAMLIIVLASLAFYLSGDPGALDPAHETLRGVLSTKNTMGRIAAVGLLACAATAFLDRSRIRGALLAAVPMVIALALTDSATGLVTAVLLVAALGSAALAREAVGKAFLAGGMTIVLAVLLVVAPGTTADEVTSVVGRDTSLTGRTELWRLSLEAATDRPLLGHGYGAFWHPTSYEGADAASVISDRLHYPVPHAHNGLIDAVLTLGAAGALLALMLVGGVLLRGARAARHGRHEFAVLQLSLGLLVVVSNLVESSLLRENNLLTILFVLAVAAPHAGSAVSRPPPLARSL